MPTPAQRFHPGSEAAILGFSVRSLAEAVAALGMRPVVLDHFGDRDTRQAAASYIHVDWSALGQPSGTSAPLTQLVAQLEQAVSSRTVVLLGGGTENQTGLVDVLGAKFLLLGPPVAQLKTVRNVDFWLSAATHAGLCFPETIVAMHPHGNALPPRSGDHSKASAPSGGEESIRSGSEAISGAAESNWLSKPHRGAGGIKIRRAAQASAGCYLQRQIAGRSLGACCVLSDDGCQLLGVTESYDQADWFGPTEFIYRGSWGPIEIAEREKQCIQNLADYVHKQTGYKGWLQVDFIQDSLGELWLLEMNPRWTAGMEVLHATGTNPVVRHLSAFGAGVRESRIYFERSAGGNTTEVAPDSKVHPRYFAKAVYYARHDILLTADVLAALHAKSHAEIGDVPDGSMLGETVAAGHPLLTLKATLPADKTQTSGEGDARMALLGQLLRGEANLAAAIELGQRA